MAGIGGVLAGKAYVRLGLDSNEYVRGLRAAEHKLSAFGSKMTSIGGRMVGGSAAIAAPLLMAVKAASNMQETMSKFDVVFGRNSDAVKSWGDEYGKQVGRSKQQVADFLASSQDLFVPMGFDASAAEDMSKTVTKLAVDLASFNNKADSDVLRDLHAALTGSGEVMKKYGVMLSEATVKQELLNQSLDPTAATEVQKAHARLNIILRGTAAAQGDALRTVDSLANRTKALQGVIDDAAVSIGQSLVPVLAPLVGDTAAVVEAFGAWAEKNKDFVVGIAEVAAGLGTAGIAMIAVGQAATGAAAAVGVLNTLLVASAANPLVAVAAVAWLSVAAIAALTSHTAALTDEMSKALTAADETRAADRDRMTQLEQLAAKQALSVSEMASAKSIITSLSDKYGDLGLSVNEATGAIEGMTDAQKRLNAAQSVAAKRDLKAAIAEEQANLSELIAAKDADANWLWVWELGGEEADLDAQQAKINAKVRRIGDLVDRYGSLVKGETEAPGQREAPTTDIEPMMRGKELEDFEARVNEKKAIREKENQDFQAFQEQSARNTQEVQDQINRQKIENTYRAQLPGDRSQATRLDYEKNIALLALEKAEAYRESSVTGVGKAKIDELFDSRRKVLDFDYAGAMTQATRASEGTYSASSAFRMGLGGKVDDKAVKATKRVEDEIKRNQGVLENIEKNTRAKGMGR